MMPSEHSPSLGDMETWDNLTGLSKQPWGPRVIYGDEKEKKKMGCHSLWNRDLESYSLYSK